MPRIKAPTWGNIQVVQEDYDLLNQIWLLPMQLTIADASVLASARFHLFRTGRIPKVQATYLQRYLAKQLEVLKSRTPQSATIEQPKEVQPCN